MNFDQDFDKFLSTLTIIADYCTKTLSEGVQMLYWRGLQKYDLAAVEKALWDHLGNPDTGHLMPKIADVVRYLQGRTVDQAAIAWSKVDAAVRQAASCNGPSLKLRERPCGSPGCPIVQVQGRTLYEQPAATFSRNRC